MGTYASGLLSNERSLWERSKALACCAPVPHSRPIFLELNCRDNVSKLVPCIPICTVVLCCAGILVPWSGATHAGQLCTRASRLVFHIFYN
jgi:hypothetical protein